MARSARRWWATGLDFQMAVNFFLYNILSCLLSMTVGAFGSGLRQETEIFWEVLIQAWRERERIPELCPSFNLLRGMDVWGSIFIWMEDGHLCDTDLKMTFLEAGKRNNRLHGCCPCAISHGLVLDLMVCTATLKFFIIFEQGIPHFNSALGPANYVVGPAEHSWVAGAECGLNRTKCARNQIFLYHA